MFFAFHCRNKEILVLNSGPNMIDAFHQQEKDANFRGKNTWKQKRYLAGQGGNNSGMWMPVAAAARAEDCLPTATPAASLLLERPCSSPLTSSTTKTATAFCI
jgi:hypothetical protein